MNAKTSLSMILQKVEFLGSKTVAIVFGALRWCFCIDFARTTTARCIESVTGKLVICLFHDKVTESSRGVN